LIGAAFGVPLFFITRGPLGNGPAMLILFLCIAPFAFLALYEKDGQPAKKWLATIFRHKLYPQRRLYKTQNFYGKINHLTKEVCFEQKQKTNTNSTTRAPGQKRQGGQGQQKRPKVG
jgi:hypothetical protein